jgi:histidine kinase-like protein
VTGERSRREETVPEPAEGMPPRPARLEQDFDDGSLYALRSAVAAHAAAAGLPPARVHDVVAAAHEMAANAVRHGAGHGRLRLRAADGVLTCQVTDDGPASPGQDGKPEGDNPVAGQAQPRPVADRPGRQPVHHRPRPGRHDRHRRVHPQPPRLTPRAGPLQAGVPGQVRSADAHQGPPWQQAGPGRLPRRS